MSKIEGEPDCCSDKSSGHEVLKKAGLKVEKFEICKGMRMHCVVRKIVEK